MSGIKKRVIKLIAFFCVFFLCLGFLMVFSVNASKENRLHLHGFYLEPENSLDVIFIGASELYSGFSPPLAYKEQGFTSYQICFPGAPASLYRSMLREGLSRQTPKLVVVEVNGFFYGEGRMYDEAVLRRWLDTMEKNENWRQTIAELIPQEERYSYYFNYFKYHSAWYKIPEVLQQARAIREMDRTGYSLMKSLGTKTTSLEKSTKNIKEKKLTKIGKQYLESFMEYCKEQNVNVLFVRFPHEINMNQDSEKKLSKAIKKAGYDYINFDNYHEGIGLTGLSVFYNAEHLNAIGQEKFTKYLSRYLATHYDLSAEHPAEVKRQWEHCAAYAEKVFAVLKEKTLQNEKKQYNETSDFGVPKELVFN